MNEGAAEGIEASWYASLSGGRVRCELCPHRCEIAEGRRGRCKTRQNRGGKLYTLTYARAASVAVDPVEKKPLHHFFPGETLLSVGSWGCNFTCSFCQNHAISQREAPTRELTASEAAALARKSGAVGVACTYNEPFVCAEYVRACGEAAHAAGLANVVVTNGFVNPEPLEELLPVVDAMNIDIKAFHEGFYTKLCGGSLAPVLATAARAARDCHVEVTTLVIPEYNDAPKELDELALWVADNCGRETPAHLSAYFPRYRLTAAATSDDLLLKARDIFRRRLAFVYLGNTAAGADTVCPTCGATAVSRRGYATDAAGLTADGRCAACGGGLNMVRSLS